MINYTERLTLLMQDVVTRVEALSFIDMADVLVFARQGRTTPKARSRPATASRCRRASPATTSGAIATPAALPAARSGS